VNPPKKPIRLRAEVQAYKILEALGTWCSAKPGRRFQSSTRPTAEGHARQPRGEHGRRHDGRARAGGDGRVARGWMMKKIAKNRPGARKGAGVASRRSAVVLPARPDGDDIFPGQEIDPEILPVVDALRADGVATLGSCCGHGENRAYIDLAVEGLAGLKRLVERLNAVRRKLDDAAWFDVALNWSEDVATAFDFVAYPTWIMLSLNIEAVDGASPSRALLARVGKAYAAKDKP
jgi:hypothetical protein